MDPKTLAEIEQLRREALQHDNLAFSDFRNSATTKLLMGMLTRLEGVPPETLPTLLRSAFDFGGSTARGHLAMVIHKHTMKGDGNA